MSIMIGIIVVYCLLMGWMILLSIRGLKAISELNKNKAIRIQRFLIRNRCDKLKVVK
jgi:hypothetical protein